MLNIQTMAANQTLATKWQQKDQVMFAQRLAQSKSRLAERQHFSDGRNFAEKQRFFQSNSKKKYIFDGKFYPLNLINSYKAKPKLVVISSLKH